MIAASESVLSGPGFRLMIIEKKKKQQMIAARSDGGRGGMVNT